MRVAQLRGRIATLARGGRYDLALDLLGDLVRADLALGLPADALLRARQVAQLARGRGEPVAGPLVVLAATLLAADAFGEAIEAAAAAIAEAHPDERPRIELMARLVGGAAQRRARVTRRRRDSCSTPRAAPPHGSARRTLAGFALAELAWVDLAEDRAAAAATCFEFAAEFLRRAHHALGARGRGARGRVLGRGERARPRDRARRDRRRRRARRESPRARRVRRRRARGSRAAQRARGGTGGVRARRRERRRARGVTASRPDRARARAGRAQARLRQVRVSDRSQPTARATSRPASSSRSSSIASARGRGSAGSCSTSSRMPSARAPLPARGELERVATAIARLGDDELAEMARGVLAELGLS